MLAASGQISDSFGCLSANMFGASQSGTRSVFTGPQQLHARSIHTWLASVEETDSCRSSHSSGTPNSKTRFSQLF